MSEKVWVHLYGGEQDGYRRKIELKTSTPKRFYIWRLKDGTEIEEAKGKDSMVLRARLATMAYEIFDEVQIKEHNTMITEYRYRRCESADKPVPDPAH